MAKLVHDLGNVYQSMPPLKNGSPLFWALLDTGEHARRWEQATLDQYADAENRIAAAISKLDSATMDRADADLIKQEIRNTAAMLRLACRRGRARLHKPDPSLPDQAHLVAESHRQLWLARNRPGGLSDSVARLGHMFVND
jgi:hypothetical protein